jgi:hypothetical protein
MAIAAAIAKFDGRAMEMGFLRWAFALPALFNSAPEDYAECVPGWAKYLSVLDNTFGVCWLARIKPSRIIYLGQQNPNRAAFSVQISVLGRLRHGPVSDACTYGQILPGTNTSSAKSGTMALNTRTGRLERPSRPPSHIMPVRQRISTAVLSPFQHDLIADQKATRRASQVRRPIFQLWTIHSAYSGRWSAHLLH